MQKIFEFSLKVFESLKILLKLNMSEVKELCNFIK
jgi:hypothetical protein